MKKLFLMLGLFVALMLSHPAISQEVPSSGDEGDPVAPTAGDNVVSGLRLFVPPIVRDVLPDFGTQPEADEKNPLIKSNAFGVDFGPYLPGFNQITARTSYMSKYYWYGQNRFSDDSAWTVGSTYGIPNITEGAVSGIEGMKFYFDITTIQPGSDGSEAQKENQYTIFSVQTFNEGESTEMELMTKHVYYDFFDQGSDADGQEIGVQVALTNLLKDENQRLVPSYYLGRIWDRDPMGPAADSDKGNISVVGADYYLNIDENTDTDLHVFGNLTYLDAVGGSDSELSYVTLGADVDFDIGSDTIVTPFVQYIKFMDDSSATAGEDADIWGGVSLNFNF
jgi:hypothetical protein